MDAPPAALWRVIEGVGGENGWYSFPLAWSVRGWLDRLVGGVGLRRGRRDPHRLCVGEALDFWRVEEIVPGELLRLRAEMRLPGRAWLEMRGRPDGANGTSVYRQRAVFLPRGLAGHAYWAAVLAVPRASIFGGMARNIARGAENPQLDRRMLGPDLRRRSSTADLVSGATRADRPAPVERAPVSTARACRIEPSSTTTGTSSPVGPFQRGRASSGVDRPGSPRRTRLRLVAVTGTPAAAITCSVAGWSGTRMPDRAVEGHQPVAAAAPVCSTTTVSGPGVNGADQPCGPSGGQHCVVRGHLERRARPCASGGRGRARLAWKTRTSGRLDRSRAAASM